MQESFFDTPVKYLPGVGPVRADILEKEVNVRTFSDLLHYFPFRYVDRTKIYRISEIDHSLPFIQITGHVTRIDKVGKGRGERLIAEFSDGTGTIKLVWFKGLRWIISSLKPNTEYLVFGKPSLFMGRINIAHPEMDMATDENIKFASGLQAIYPITEKLTAKGLNSRGIARLIYTLLQMAQGKISENLSPDLISKYKLINREDALNDIHRPSDSEILKKAEFRLKFEELFFIQLSLLQSKIIRIEKVKGIPFPVVGNYVNRFYKEILPFPLTESQKKVIKEIRKDLGSRKQMNRLLQGDVGSGKTLVALMAILIALDNGYQACIMAPTGILANQHFKTISGYLEKLGVATANLTGSIHRKEKNIIYQKLSSGEIRVCIGTHALIQDEVKFKNLGLAVIDEQHRFGVAQRAILRKKNNPPPHILVMTATPIPRTLAMTVYGDIDVSVIDEMPPGRKPVKTYHRYDNGRVQTYNFVTEQVNKGRQAYVVFPIIEESETLDFKNLLAGFNFLKQIFPDPTYTTGMAHGRMEAGERDDAMRKFTAGETQILVATNVIEVGVDIPNATVMVIESAERFGLSQLHQLRGRIGRGAEQSFCILLTGKKLSNDTIARINVMCRTNDGFEIAEQDLKLRGPGDLEGTQQSGIAGLRIANLAKDGQIISLARDAAMELLKKDPHLKLPQHGAVAVYLNDIRIKKTDWAGVG